MMKRNIVFLKLTSLIMAFLVVLTVLMSVLYEDGYIGNFPGSWVIDAVINEIMRPRGNSTSQEVPVYENNGLESGDEPYIEGSGVIENAQVDTIYIDWAFGDISIVETDDTAISIIENLSAEYQMKYRVVGNSLEIKYSQVKPDYYYSSRFVKNLTLIIPESPNINGKSNYDISVTSNDSNIYIRNLAVNNFNVYTTNGDIVANNCKINTMFSETRAGDLYVNSHISDLTAKVEGRGNIDCVFEKAAKNVNLSLGEGAVTVRAPEDLPGYLVKVNWTGEHEPNDSTFAFHTDFEYEQKNEFLYAYGDESLFINVAIGSGDVAIGSGDVSVYKQTD